MAKGTESKNEVFKKILEIFPGSFMYNDNKEVRLNFVENGEPVQLKLALTTAKTPVESDESTSAFDSTSATGVKNETFNWDEVSFEEKKELTEPTAEEKQNVAKLVEALGLGG